MDPALLHRVAAEIARARSVVAFTGAGVSAESGLDTFREPGGLWDRFDASDVGTAGGFMELLLQRPWKAAEFLGSLRDAFAGARPNDAHRALAALEQDGALTGVVTQNVDGLHQEGGSRNVVELHGNLLRRRCTGCGRTAEVSRTDLVSDLRHLVRKLESCLVSHPAQVFDRCECGGLMRPDVVLFGEPARSWDEGRRLIVEADIVLVVGSSGAVYPAAELPEVAKQAGALVVEVNPQPSEFTDLAEVRLSGPAATVLPALVRAARSESQARRAG